MQSEWVLAERDQRARECVTFHALQVRKAIRDGDETLYDALVQEGLIALLDAEQHFDASRGVAFSTFVDKYVMGAMLRYKREYVRSRSGWSGKVMTIPWENLEPEPTQDGRPDPQTRRSRDVAAVMRRQDVEATVIRNLTLDDLRDALSTLPLDERRVIATRVQWPTGPTISIQATADQLGMSRTTAYGLERSAYRRLRESRPGMQDYLDNDFVQPPATMSGGA